MADIEKKTAAPATVGTGAELQQAFQNRQAQSTDKIGTLYDKQLQSQKTALQGAYEQNLSDQMAARNQIGGTYQTASNDLAVQFERNKRNLNQQALANGLNTGAASQQQLALNQGWMKNYGALKGQQAAAYTEADRQITNLKNQYQNNIASAIADNDYKRAAALLDDYNNQNNWYDKQAQLLAGYGDFSAYASLYGPEAANNMKQIWIVQNPDAAYATGQIDKEQYKKITGKNPGKKKSNGGSYTGPYVDPNGNGGDDDNGDNKTSITTVGDLGWNDTAKMIKEAKAQLERNKEAKEQPYELTINNPKIYDR